jgi:hypothetical protein
MAYTQEFTPLSESDRKIIHKQKEIKTDVFDGYVLDTTTIQPQNEILLLEQALTKQYLLLKENMLLNQDMATQQTFINNLSRTVATLKNIKLVSASMSANHSSIQPTTASLSDVESSLKEQTNKKLQSKRIDQLFNSTVFSGSDLQEVSDSIQEFNNKCDQLKLDEPQRFSIAFALLNDNVTLWYETQKYIINNWGNTEKQINVLLQACNWHRSISIATKSV